NSRAPVSVVVLVQAELRVHARMLQAAVGQPCRSAVLGARYKFAGLREIVGRTFQRAEWRGDVILDLRIEGLKLADQLPRDQQSQRMQSGRDRASRRLLQRAGIAGGQDNEPLSAARHRDLDRRVASDGAVGEIKLFEMDGWEGRR